MSKPFLLLQLRPEHEAADGEMEAFMKFGKLRASDVRRIRMEQAPFMPINLDEYAGIIMGGGPSNVSDDEASKSSAQKRFEQELAELFEQIIAKDFPFLGACYGLGILAKNCGGTVSKEKYGEPVGATTIELTESAADDPLTAGLNASFRAFGGHKEACQNVPPGAVLLATSDSCPVQMIRLKQNMYATQFHTELDKAGLALRINIYKDAGYFPPEDAAKLVEASKDEIVTEPEKILRRFVERFRA